MKAIVLAGGKGTRLGSVVSDVPKPLASIRGEPFLSILIRFLIFHGINEVFLSIGHLSEKFDEALKEFKKISPSVFLVREESLLGTGGAVRYACQTVCHNDETVLVLNGDTFFDF